MQTCLTVNEGYHLLLSTFITGFMIIQSLKLIRLSAVSCCIMSIMQSVIVLHCPGLTLTSAWARFLTSMRDFYASIAMMTQATAEDERHGFTTHTFLPVVHP